MTQPWQRIRWLAVPGLIEFLLMVVIIAAYQVTKYWATADVDRAFASAHALHALEGFLYIDIELPLQRAFLDKPRLLTLINRFYVHSHFAFMLGFLVWLFVAHRQIYPRMRNAFALLHGFALLVFVLYPCAPPRMLPDLGFVDTIAVMSGGLPYEGVHNPYAAFPSVHFAYAFFFAVVTRMVTRNMWLRALTMAYLVAVFIAITVTGNHFVLDCLGGMVVTLAALAVVHGIAARSRPSAAENVLP